MSNQFKKHFVQFGMDKLKYTGYSYPLEMLRFKKIKFNDLLVNIPINTDTFLTVTYGKDWQTPKKDYIWYEEAKNLIDLNEK